jgi:hypothetical protein
MLDDAAGNFTGGGSAAQEGRGARGEEACGGGGGGGMALLREPGAVRSWARAAAGGVPRERARFAGGAGPRCWPRPGAAGPAPRRRPRRARILGPRSDPPPHPHPWSGPQDLGGGDDGPPGEGGGYSTAELTRPEYSTATFRMYCESSGTGAYFM